MRDRTSCASRNSDPSGLTPLAESCAAGRAVAADLLLTVTAALPLPIAPPGFPIALGLSFFFFPVLVNALAPYDFRSPDRTDLAATGPAWGAGTCSRAGAATVGTGGICALGAGEAGVGEAGVGEAGVGRAGVGGAGTCVVAADAAGPGAPPTWSPTVAVGTEPTGDWAGRRGGSKTLALGLFAPDDPEAVVVWSGDRVAGDPAPREVRSAAGVAGILVVAVGAAGVAGVAGGAAEPAAGDFQPTLVVAAEDGPAPRAAPPDEACAGGDAVPADGDAAGDGAADGGAPGEGGGLAWCVTSRLVTPVLANPGLAKPAAVSPRASAAAASVSAAPSCEPAPGEPPAGEPPAGEPSVRGTTRVDSTPGKPVLVSVGPTAPAPGGLAPAGFSC
jgi:hypothetical protein